MRGTSIVVAALGWKPISLATVLPVLPAYQCGLIYFYYLPKSSRNINYYISKVKSKK